MRTHNPLTLLGGLTPAQFMKRHWQRKPLLVRGAVPGSEGGQVVIRPSLKAARLAKRNKIIPTKAAATAKPGKK